MLGPTFGYGTSSGRSSFGNSPRFKMKTHWTLGEDPLYRSPRPLLMARQLRQWLRPIRDYLVRTSLILSAFFTRDRREPGCRRRRWRCRLRRTLAARDDEPQRHRDTESGEGFHSGLVYDRGMIQIHRFLFVALLASTPAGAQTTSEIDAYYPDLQTLYQDIHRNPELAFQEVQTAAKLAARLKALGYEVTTGVGRTGVVGLLRNGAGPTVMLRTELDALPVAEKTGRCVREHRDHEEPRRRDGPRDARLRSRPAHDRVERHREMDGRASTAVAWHADAGRTAGGRDATAARRRC